MLVIGETGVGKELMAQALHRHSGRAGPLVPINCSAVPENLIESELFGYERGAFSGATRSKPGLLETASDGTLMLDEVGDLPLNVQVKLLRALESGEFVPVGGLEPRTVDLRIVAATNRSLKQGVADGTFRSDLYYRLNGITLEIPPLRDRMEDVELLARTFAKGDAGTPIEIKPDALAVLKHHRWPGNVRELRNTIERACVLSRGRPIEARHVLLDGSVDPDPEIHDRAQLKSEIQAIERKRIVDALNQTSGNQTSAARLLGISRRTLINRIEAFGLPRPRKAPKKPRD